MSLAAGMGMLWCAGLAVAQANQVAQADQAKDGGQDAGTVVLNLGQDASGRTMCPAVKLSSDTGWPRLLERGAHGTMSVGRFGMLRDGCTYLASEYDVPNRQRVKVLTSRYDVDSCTITLSAPTRLKKDDIGKELAGVFSSSIIGGLVGGAVPRAETGSNYATRVEQETLLPPLEDASVTVTIACKRPAEKENMNDVNDGRRIGPAPHAQMFVLNYHDATPVTGSAGGWMSLLGKKSYGVKTASTGQVAADGTQVTVSTVNVVSSSTVQFVPAGFANVYLTGTRSFNLNLQAGLGINPNGSAVQVEYLVGPAVGWHGLYAGAGVHIAQAQRLLNNFYVGEPVSMFLTVPTGWYTTYRVGFSLSYRPPVP